MFVASKNSTVPPGQCSCLRVDIHSTNLGLRTLLLLGNDIGWDAVWCLVDQHEHRTEGKSHQAEAYTEANHRAGPNLSVHTVRYSLANSFDTAERSTVSNVCCMMSACAVVRVGTTKLTLRVGRKGREKPVHVRLGQRARRLDEEVWQERASVQRLVPVDCARVVLVEFCLNDDSPNVDSEVQQNDSKETNLCASTLAEALHVEYKTKTKAANNAEKGRDERG